MVWCGVFMIVEKKVKFKRISKRNADDIKNRLVSIVHGIVSFWASFYILASTIFFEHIANLPPIGEANFPEHHYLIILSMSYFLYDLLACVYYDLEDMPLFLHHGLVFAGYFSSIYTGYGGSSCISKHS
jgi:hypothetical protein